MMNEEKAVPVFSHLEGLFDSKPSELTTAEFLLTFGSVYEHSKWVAEAAWSTITEQNKSVFFDDRENLAQLFFNIVEGASRDRKLALLRAHPDLAGKAALAGQVTPDSTSEQAGAGLDQCTADELTRFTRYNEAYQLRFGFPFIMAVKGATKETILAGFESRLENGKDDEFDMAIRQVHQIARFRLAQK